MYHNNDNNNDNNSNNINAAIELSENEINEWITSFNCNINQISCKSNDQNNTLIMHAKYINTIDEKITSYKEEIDNFNNTLTEIKDMIIDDFEDYDKKFNDIKKKNIELNDKINKEAYISNFIIITILILISLLIFKDLYDSDVIANFNFTNFINEKNNTNINKGIETIINDRISEL